ncbi:MAG: hypothetical protein KF752_18905 [Pirellulaceae bacterium]|nr:hypothetical protein [Pirellulaceae bacterium]
MATVTGRTIRLHESTQRAICRASFVLLSLLPLALCLVWTVASYLPGYGQLQADRWQQRLAGMYGLTFRIDAVESLAPYRYRVTGVQLLHPETQAAIGQASSVDLHWEGGQWMASLTDMQVQLDQCLEACRIVHQWYMCRPGAQRYRATVTCKQLIIESAQQSQRIDDAVVQTFPETDKWGFKATFHHRDATEPKLPTKASQLLMVRRHDTNQSATELQLRAETPLPCWLLWEFFQGPPSADSLPVGWPTLQPAWLTGVLDVRYQSNSSSLYLSDVKISQLDLSRWAFNQSAVMSGRADLHIAQAKFGSLGLDWAEGRLEMGPGRIDASFLQSLGRYAQIQLPQSDLAVDSVSFDRLAAAFRIQPQQIQLLGQLSPSGCILQDARGPLAARLDPAPIPLTNLVYAIGAGHPALARQALVWLPLEERQRQQASAALRISRNQPHHELN